MKEYEALDLSALCNAGIDVLGEGQTAPVGRQTFHGLPFLIGSDGRSSSDRRFVHVAGSAANVTIPVNRTARSVIFAHRLLESPQMARGVVGADVAEYVFHLSGGQSVQAPIRERFEIGVILGSDLWSRMRGMMVGVPFAAIGDQKEDLLPRYEGRWEAAGRRQTEATRGAPSYYLWAWKNPEPDRAIESLEIVPKGAPFIVAAITVGHVDEHPFVRQGRREVRIVLTDQKEAERPFDLDVEVDRGATTYAHPLPERSGDEFMKDSVKGWGESQNGKSSPAYAEIAAIPSATVAVKQGGEEVGSVRWSEVEEKGLAATSRMRVEMLDRGRNWVRVTVLDDDTGRPVPCRVHFRSPEGIPYQPHGHHNQVNSNLDTFNIDVGGDVRLGQITYAYIDGTCQGWLPRGEVIVDVARGYEYDPLRTKVTIKPGQRELTLRIKRWINMNARGWFSGDSHVHFLSTLGSHMESRGEDLNVVNLLQSQWGSLFTSTEEFTGRPSVSQDGNSIVYVSQENRQHLLGHMVLWGLKEPVMPLSSDGLTEAELGGTMETTMSYWADACHAQGGTVIIPHFPAPNGEPAVLIATGRAEGVETIRHDSLSQAEYYRYLNCGYRLPYIGGTDKVSSDIPVGLYRTYVHIPEEEGFDYDNWRKNVARGRTFVSGGPIIHFSVEGHQLGDTMRLSGAGTVEVEAWAESIFPVHTLEIVQEGRVVASAEDRKGARRLELKAKVKVDGHTWLAARCGGPSHYDSVPHHDAMNRGIFAHTSPIYIACGGEWEMFDEQTARYMLAITEGDLTYIRDSAPRYQHGTVTHQHGEDDHLAYLERPFLEAREAILRRLNSKGGR